MCRRHATGRVKIGVGCCYRGWHETILGEMVERGLRAQDAGQKEGIRA